MDPVSKRETALKLLAANGVWRSNSAPPVARLMWRLGFNVPPPHFARFASVALFYGGFFALAWGFFMWLFFWSHQGYALLIAVSTACLAGAFFGLGMAGYYKYCRNKFNLPNWHSLGNENARN